MIARTADSCDSRRARRRPVLPASSRRTCLGARRQANRTGKTAAQRERPEQPDRRRAKRTRPLRIATAQDDHAERNGHEGEQRAAVADVREHADRKQARENRHANAGDQGHDVGRLEPRMDAGQRFVEGQQSIARHREENARLAEQHHQHHRRHRQKRREADELRSSAPAQLTDDVRERLGTAGKCLAFAGNCAGSRKARTARLERDAGGSDRNGLRAECEPTAPPTTSR